MKIPPPSQQYVLRFKDACFACDMDGRIDVTALNATAFDNYEEHVAPGEIGEVVDCDVYFG